MSWVSTLTKLSVTPLALEVTLTVQQDIAVLSAAAPGRLRPLKRMDVHLRSSGLQPALRRGTDRAESYLWPPEDKRTDGKPERRAAGCGENSTASNRQ